MRRVIASVGVAATAVAAVAIAGPAANAGPHRPAAPSAAPSSLLWEVNSATAAVRTNAGKTLHLVLSAQRPSSGKETLTVELFTGKRFASLGESHKWTFGSDALAAKAGHATIKSGHALGKYGSLSLTFSSGKKHSAACASGQESYWYGSLAGRITFNSEGRAWGSFSRKSFRFTGRNELVRDDGCQRKHQPPSVCVNERRWYPPSGNFTGNFTGGSVGGGAPEIVFYREVKLSSPKDAKRDDILIGASTLSGTRSKLTISATGKGFTGKATIQHGKPPPFSYPCTLNGQKRTETATDYQGPWSSTGTSRLAAHFAIDGNPILAPKSGSATFLVESYS
jgi:hypothetical protein